MNKLIGFVINVGNGYDAILEKKSNKVKIFKTKIDAENYIINNKLKEKYSKIYICNCYENA